MVTILGFSPHPPGHYFILAMPLGPDECLFDRRKPTETVVFAFPSVPLKSVAGNWAITSGTTNFEDDRPFFDLTQK